MPLPLLLIAIAVGTGAFGAERTIDGVSKSKKAKKLNEEAKQRFDEAAAGLKQAKTSAGDSLTSLGKKKLLIYDKSIGGFVQAFEKLKNVELSSFDAEKYKLPPVTHQTICDMKTASLNAGSIVAGGLTGIGAGALAGVAAYGGATLLASASTGTAIAALSGIAAQNATLAWFGGGSLAAGGAGIAGGTLVLGGLVAGPALLVTGLMLSGKARKAYAEAQANLDKAKVEAKKMQVASGMLDSITALSNQIKNELVTLQRILDSRVSELKSIRDISGDNYAIYNTKEKEAVHLAVLTAQLVRKYLDVKILRKDGKLARSARKEVTELKQVQRELKIR